MRSLPALLPAVPVLLGAMGCAPALHERPPLEDPSDAARQLETASGTERDAPAFLRFDWSYSDERGDVRGQGAGRFNPPDSIRLDLFTSGESSTAVALTGHRVTSREAIEDVELPGPPFLWAMAGFFRPPDLQPAAGYRIPEGRAIRYRLPGDTVRDFYFEDDLLVKVEERSEGHLLRRATVEWEGSRWPARAVYRNFTGSRRVRWTLTETRHPADRYPPGIYELSTPSSTSRLDRPAVAGGLRVRLFRRRGAPRAHPDRRGATGPERNASGRTLRPPLRCAP